MSSFLMLTVEPGHTGVMADAVNEEVLLLGVTQSAQVFGMVSFELFGTFHNTFDNADALFDAHIDLGLAAFGLA